MKKKSMEKIKDWWHDLWFPLRNWISYKEIAFYKNEVKRLLVIISEKDADIRGERDKFGAWFKKDSETLRELQNKLHEMLAVDPAKVVRVDEVIVEENGKPIRKKVLTVGGETLTPELSKVLKEETAYVKRTMWWTLVQNSLGEMARQNMFENSKDFCDMHAGKATLHSLKIQKELIDKILDG